MSEPIITVYGLSKQYRMGTRPGPSAIWSRIPQRFLKGFRSTAKRSNSGTANNELFWALKDINFDVAKGERIGIIGRNGAGKSTLLKILSRVTYPTEGEVRIRGRVTSLLEVGTGFNDNLTGRENIYLNASLHGLGRTEIDAKLNDIIEFSGIGRFIDTPVKHYSSGMRMRLAFSVAAHLDPDVLLLDEVLAVGDMSFQQKCLQRVEGLTSEGRTLLFVSHSMDAIARFCNRCIWFDSGSIVMDGPVLDVVTAYAESVLQVKSSRIWSMATLPNEPSGGTSEESKTVPKGEEAKQGGEFQDDATNEFVRLVSARVIDVNHKTVTTIGVNEPVGVEVVYDILTNKKKVQPALHFKTAKQIMAFVVAYTDQNFIGKIPKPGRHTAVAWLPPNFLNTGVMYVNVALEMPDPLERLIKIENALSFNVHEAGDPRVTARGLYGRDFPGVVRPLLRWETTYTSVDMFPSSMDNHQLATSV